MYFEVRSEVLKQFLKNKEAYTCWKLLRLKFLILFQIDYFFHLNLLIFVTFFKFRAHFEFQLSMSTRW